MTGTQYPIIMTYLQGPTHWWGINSCLSNEILHSCALKKTKKNKEHDKIDHHKQRTSLLSEDLQSFSFRIANDVDCVVFSAT